MKPIKQMMRIILFLCLFSNTWLLAQPGTVKSFQKISDTEGGFTGILENGDFFGNSVANIGDLDGDGVIDLAVGAERDDDGGANKGAVRILFMNQDGTVKSLQKISATEGNFNGVLNSPDNSFGRSVSKIGDLNGDGILDIAVGDDSDDDGGTQQGAVWILFLNNNGTVKAEQKISETQGGFSGVLDNGDNFGRSITSIGDLNGDGIPDLAVGANHDDDGGSGAGAVWILFLNNDGTVNTHQKISPTVGNFSGSLNANDRFGSAVASIGDLNNDGVFDLAVGANLDDDGGFNTGAIWVIFLNGDGTVKNQQKISSTQGNFTGTLNNSNSFGQAISAIGDISGDNITDLVVGAWLDNDGGPQRGAVWVLFLDSDGTVKAQQKISDTEGGFLGVMDDSDRFGINIASLGDLDGDGITDIAVGARQDDDGGPDRGAVWVLFLDGINCNEIDNDGDGASLCDDCDDNDPNNYPGNAEVCDGADNNCDGQIDEGFDQDNDGFTSCNGDCDDNDPNNYPGNVEVCDGADNNCDGQIDEGFDLDNDGVADCFDNCPATPNPDQADSDCDGVGDVCDQWHGCDDSLDTDNDGTPDCVDLDELDNWDCHNNGKKAYICHIPPGNPANQHTICISKNAVPTHLNNHGDYIGECVQISCNTNLSTPADQPLLQNIGTTALDEILVYPNPTDHHLTIDLSSLLDKEVAMELRNTNGQLIQIFDLGPVNSDQYELQVDHLPAGVYWLKINVLEGESFIKRLIVQ